MRLGPLYMNPTIALTNMGIDSNVFNEPDQIDPKRDFTMTLTPATEMWLRLGRSWLTGTVREDLVYYHEYAGERSANTFYKGGWFVPLNRLTMKAGADYAAARERPGFEIDARSLRHDAGYNGTVEVRALSKTFFGIRGERRKVDFDGVATFEGVNLREALNRNMLTEALTVRHEVTALTSVTFEASRTQDRFDLSPLRDSDSKELAAGVQFDPFALIKGSARFGYRDFEPLSPGIPAYKGTTASVDLSYVALGATKLDTQLMRDVRYSFEINEPYYIQTGFTGSVAQQVFGPVDLVGRIGAHQLAYRSRTDAAVQADRTDRIRSYGGGVGYHMGQDIRIGFNIDQQKRTSTIELRRYDGLRFGISVTFGS